MSSISNDLAVQSEIFEVDQNDPIVDQVKKNIEDCYPWYLEDKCADLIYDEIFGNSPFSFEQKDLIVESILNGDCCVKNKLLEVFLAMNPKCCLSPLQDVLRQILVDEECVLDYQALRGLLENRGVLTEENIDLCVDFAYKRNHHGLVAPSQTPLEVHDYVLNFLWVNLDAQSREDDSAEHVFGTGLNAESNKNFLSKVSLWAQAHPGSTINLWIDTALVTEKAALRTIASLKEISEEKGVGLSLKDLRSLPNVQSTMGRYFHPSIPVYFRVDLAKILIADQMMALGDHKYVIVSDIDISPQSNEVLFDKKTQNFLEDFGYVFNRNGMGNFENSFFIFSTEKPQVKEEHEKALIRDLHVKIAGVDGVSLGASLRPEFVFSSQTAFNGYEAFRGAIERPRGLYGSSLYLPRKVVATPPSQFNLGGRFPISDHRSEQFRFSSSEKNVPYVRQGRAMQQTQKGDGYIELPRYKNFTPSPLSLDDL